MQISRRKLSAKIEKDLYRTFYQLVADIKSPEEAEAVLTALLTEAEMTSLIKRLGAGLYLRKNKSYATIKRMIKVSSATIASVKVQMEKYPTGYQIAFEKIEADRWSRAMSKKISGFFKPKVKK